MAKNELLPFANGEDANVLPTQQWEALTDILENGFQSGIARSEQVNRVLAQGAVASYVLGQLIVEQLNKDATLDKDTLYQNLVSALQENAKDACLPLSGGTMTGVVRYANTEPIVRTVNDSGFSLCGGTEPNNGAFLRAFGKNAPNNEGVFACIANNGTSIIGLIGKPDGTLTWGDKNVACIESWTDGTNWYRKWSDGWIEQGGIATGTNLANAGGAITLPVPFSNSNYIAVMTPSNISGGPAWSGNPPTRDRISTNTVLHWSVYGGSSGEICWYACGY